MSLLFRTLVEHRGRTVGGETRGGSEEKALHELHSDLQSFETLGAELPCLMSLCGTLKHRYSVSQPNLTPTGTA